MRPEACCNCEYKEWQEGCERGYWPPDAPIPPFKVSAPSPWPPMYVYCLSSVSSVCYVDQKFCEILIKKATNVSSILIILFTLLIFWEVFQRDPLTAHNWQKWKRVYLTCPCHKIYRVEAAGLKMSNYTWTLMIFANMWNLGQFREKMIFCQ